MVRKLLRFYTARVATLKIRMKDSAGQHPDTVINTFTLEVGQRLRRLREVVRRMSPEEVAAKVSQSDATVSASYIRRVEKGEHSPTIDKLQSILEALGSNLGLFFEDHILESVDENAKDRYCHRTVQRALDSSCRPDVISTIKIIARSLKSVGS